MVGFPYSARNLFLAVEPTRLQNVFIFRLSTEINYSEKVAPAWQSETYSPRLVTPEKGSGPTRIEIRYEMPREISQPSMRRTTQNGPV